MFDTARFKYPPEFLRRKMHSALFAGIGALWVFTMALLGIVYFSNSAQAQDTVPVVVHKRASVEEAQVDETIGYSITVMNNGRVDAALLMNDPLPDDIAYVEESVKSTAGQAFYNGDTRSIQWNGTLKGGEQATIQFQSKVLPVLDATKCAAAIVNQAVVTAADPTTTPLETAPGVVQVKRICPDLGDAPDSTNHAGVAMTAYPNPVGARYPTVFDPTTGAPQGPRHRFARADAWLGARVSGERDADLMPDEDLATNLQPSADVADRDRYDDGVTKWPTLANCVQTDMAVDVNVVGGARTRYLNAWIDWNRDGDWEDSFDCPNGKVSEWVVQNFVTNLNNGVSSVPLPPFLAWDTPNIPERDRWLRVSIAEEPAPRNPTTERADGRGPPTGYRFGETEDYHVRFEAPTAPKLEMVKQADVSVVNPGGVIEYSITVINSGSAPATGVVVNDPIPGGTSYISGSATATAGTVTYNSGLTRIEWTGNIPAGGSVTIKFKVNVSQDIPCDGVIRNRAELLDAAGTLLQDATAFVRINCPGKPILDIKKEANVPFVTPGGEIEYTITIVNGGTGPASGVTMIDPIPAGATYVSGSATSTAPTVTYDNTNNWVKWSGNLAVGGTVTIKFKVRVSEQIDCGSAIYNKASLVNANNEPVQFAEVRTPVECPKPELTMRKSANPTVVLPGGEIEYTITVVNSGAGPATGVSVIDPIPGGATYVAGSATSTIPTVTYDNTNNWVQWTGNIPAGGNVVIKFKVKVGPDRCDYPIHNRARLIDVQGVSLLAAEAQTWVGCPEQPLLKLEKRANPTSVAPGGTIEYTIVIANVGSAPASGVTMIDPIPAGTTYVTGSATSTNPTVNYDNTNNWVKWNGAIPAGGTVTVTFKVTVGDNVPCDGVIHNRAAIIGADGTAVAVAEADVKIDCGHPELTIKKRANVTQVGPGGQIEYVIEIANSGSAPATGVTMIDPIPAGTSYVPGTATATAPTVDDSNPSQIKWTGTVPAGGTVTVTFKVEVSLDVPCQETIWNRAVLFGEGFQLSTEAIPVKVICDTTDAFTDFGDAPDSRTNHSGMNNTAYSAGPVLGRFPTVWDGTPATEGSGPNHRQANQYWLGDRVTNEKDADLLPDSDGVTNILNNGTADVADQDKADDGWLNRNVALPDCREAVLKVRISRALIPPPVERLYLNVWIDGNRDGDWADVGQCPQINGRSYEWIVQNWWIDPTTIPPAGFVDVAVGTVLVHNAKPDADAWLRFTLSEQKAVAPSAGLPDGRGIAFPNAFRLGETEDYYRKGEDQGGEPGQIRIEKKAEPAGPVAVGDVVNYSIIVTHVGGTAPAFTTMQDLLPAGVALVSGPVVTELTPSAAPLVASFNPGTGPSGEVSWSGTLSPNASIRIDFRVRVRECVDQLRNVAVAKNTNGERVQAVVETKVDCQQSEPGISLTKRVRVQNATDEVTEADILSSDTAIYYLSLSTTDGLIHTVHISDDLPSGLVGVAVSASSGVANLVNSGHTAVWDGDVGPANSPITIKILVRPEQGFGCDQRLVNVAHWISGSHDGESNAVILRTTCRDLGDAPDSTNHAGAKMSAYTGVEAHFPTVFNVAAPERGPRHDRPRPFHLGKGVSAEVEADLGFDTDGLNNIEPAANKANQDKADDGLLLSTVTLNHCQTGNMRVMVSIDTTAATLLSNGVGYLNVWVDSNRDGDWADRFTCPQDATGAPGIALEHIVIDMPINAAALGAGLHTINVNTTGPVAWPADLAQRPAWLRVTLSERPANKPFTTYGDGRGYDDPFRLGETEDYLLPGLNSQGGGDADPVVTKRGEIWPDFDPTTNTRRWIVGWIVNYANLGSAAANNVHVVETYDAPQTLVAEHSIPLVPHTQSGNTLDYNVGTLAVGGAGTIIIRTAIPFDTAPGTVIRNSAVVNSDNDSVTINNSTVATVTVPVLPPVITTPIAGTTCTETVDVAGHAQPGVTVDLYVDNALETTLTADSNGDWQTTLTLATGSHDLHAIARSGSVSSPASPTVTVIVDPALFWDPISLRFVDDQGHMIIPSGRLDESGWSVFLRPGHTYTVSLHICCGDPNAQVTMEIGDISLTLSDPDGDRTFTATFTVPAGGRLTGTVRICVTCDLIRICSDGQVTIDPEGTVFDLLTGQPLAAATVACMQANVGAASGQSLFSLWNAEDYDQINPQSVAADGYFSFFTPQGTYRLQVNKSGYQSYESPDLTVVDEPVHFDVPLTPLVNGDADQQIGITDSGFEPAVITVEPGAVIEWINTGVAVHSSTSITPSVSFDGANAAGANVAGGSADNGGWDSGYLTTGESYKRQMNQEGTFIYQDSANPGATATVIVKQTTPVETAVKIFLPVVAR